MSILPHIKRLNSIKILGNTSFFRAGWHVPSSSSFYCVVVVFTGVWHDSIVQYSNAFSGSLVYLYLVVPLVAKLSRDEVIQGGCS